MQSLGAHLRLKIYVEGRLWSDDGGKTMQHWRESNTTQNGGKIISQYIKFYVDKNYMP